MGSEAESGQAIWFPAEHQQDRRQAARFDLDMRLAVRPVNNRSRVIPARIIDLSCGGLRAAIAAELETGDSVELEFGLRHTSAVVRLSAAIRWRDGYQYGLEFMFVSAADRERMRQAFAAGLLQ